MNALTERSDRDAVLSAARAALRAGDLLKRARAEEDATTCASLLRQAKTELLKADALELDVLADGLSPRPMAAAADIPQPDESPDDSENGV